ncbi:MAG: hypothetical protein K8M05_17880 [Deltaproteobacteria bacterium]|nr:hypothetical protein [Kofleriaceae bacterium]
MLTSDEIRLIVIIVGMLALIVSNRLAPDLVAMLVLLTLGAIGLVTPQQTLSGFSSPVVITLIGLFIITQALEDTGVIQWIAQRINSMGGGSEVRLVLLFMAAGATLSLVMNNVAAGAVLLPAAAAIVLAAMGASITVMALVDPSEDSALGRVLVVLLVAAPVIGAIAGAVLCGDVRPRSASGWTFGLWMSVFVIVVVADDDEHWGLVLIGGAAISAGAALASALTTWIVQKLRRRAPTVTVPAAQVVER